MLRQGYFFFDGMSLFDAAQSLKLLFDNFTAAGFTDDQAMELTKLFITFNRGDNNKVTTDDDIKKFISEVKKV